MEHSNAFRFARWWAIVLKEFLQLRRDKVTFALIIGIPIIQLTLFGYAINTDPKHLPTAVVSSDHSEFTRTLVTSMQTSEYFNIDPRFSTETEAEQALQRGEIQFILTIPPDFTRKLLRNEKPSILLEADATDPLTTSVALLSIEGIAAEVARKNQTGIAKTPAEAVKPFEIRVHRLYNPNGVTRYNIIPGLLGVILTMTLALMTALSMTREREYGTMENLLATPARPIEIIAGKIVPYIFIGLIQSTIILMASYTLFGVPFNGSIALAYLVALLFIAVNLTIGIAISSLAQNMLQAMQLTIFYILPSMLLTGFMFPFLGMPKWAQIIGELLPLTHFNRLIRGVILKNSDFAALWPDIWPLLAIGFIMLLFSLKFYRQTLD